MRPLYRNLFLLFGLIAIGVMVYSFRGDFQTLDIDWRKASLFLPAVVGIWVFVYACNARAFQIIVNSGIHEKHLAYRHAYKLTVSGFAFSYTTPFGFGGAPYRIMELNSHIGTQRAMSATVLYSMMHILSHFCLWLTGLVVFLALHFDKMTPFLWTIFAIFAAVFAVVVYFFYYGYRNGMIVKLYGILLKLPGIKRYAQKFYDKNLEAMENIDRNIAYLHSQPRAFYSALAMEYVGRVLNSFEFFFILWAFSCPVSFGDALIILAFSSLIGNLLFFFPMQLGAREGSLAAIVKILGFAGADVGLFSSFYTRIRELFWICVGIALVKFGNKKMMQ